MGRKKKRIFLTNLVKRKKQIVKEEVTEVNNQITDSVTVQVEPEPVIVTEEAIEEVIIPVTPVAEAVKTHLKTPRTSRVK